MKRTIAILAAASVLSACATPAKDPYAYDPNHQVLIPKGWTTQQSPPHQTTDRQAEIMAKYGPVVMRQIQSECTAKKLSIYDVHANASNVNWNKAEQAESAYNLCLQRGHAETQKRIDVLVAAEKANPEAAAQRRQVVAACDQWARGNLTPAQMQTVQREIFQRNQECLSQYGY